MTRHRVNTKTPTRRMPARYFVLLSDAMRQQGVDVDHLLRMAGIDAARFERSNGQLLATEVAAFIAAAQQLTGRTDLGFELGRLIKMTSHDILGYGMLSCRNADQVMRLVTRHYHLMTETFTLKYHRTPQVGEAIYTPAIAMPLEMLHFYYDVLALAHQNQLELMFGQALPAYDIYLSMPEPRHGRRYLSLAPARFHFEEHALPGVRVVMGEDLLDMPLPLADSRVVQQVEERCEALGNRPPAGDEGGWGQYVTMMLRQASGELVTLEALAARLNMSVRTLDRQLKKENLQFRDLSQQVRLERACELLAAPGATVTQVAQALGFSDAANFSRAFRRTLGLSPSRYQQDLANANATRG